MNKERNICIVGPGASGRQLRHGPDGRRVYRHGCGCAAPRPSVTRWKRASSPRARWRTLRRCWPGPMRWCWACILTRWWIGFETTQKHLRPGALLTDVCGVKSGCGGRRSRAFCARTRSLLPATPWQGKRGGRRVSTRTAPSSGAPNFHHYAHRGQTRPGAVAFAQGPGRGAWALRASRQLSCAEHDKVIGYVSQLTHAIAVSLMNANDNTHLAEYTGDSFRDLTPHREDQ